MYQMMVIFSDGTESRCQNISEKVHLSEDDPILKNGVELLIIDAKRKNSTCEKIVIVYGHEKLHAFEYKDHKLKLLF